MTHVWMICRFTYLHDPNFFQTFHLTFWYLIWQSVRDRGRRRSFRSNLRPRVDHEISPVSSWYLDITIIIALSFLTVKSPLLIWLVVDLPLWKMMEFVSWNDDIPNIWKKNIHFSWQSSELWLHSPFVRGFHETSEREAEISWNWSETHWKMRQSGQTAKNRASVNQTAMARRMRSIANNRSKTPAATLFHYWVLYPIISPIKNTMISH